MSLTVGGEAAPDRLPADTLNAYPWRYAIIAVTALVGVVTSIGMFVAVSGWQAHDAELRFTSQARDNLQTINSGLKDATDLMYSLRAYFESTTRRVSKAEYQAFSGSLRERVAGLRDTGWAPRVTAADRDAFEHEIQAAGEPGFQIVERGADGKLVRAQNRPEYFPVLYSDPGPINRPILGFDLASESVRNRAVARARTTNRPAATPPVKLLNVQRPNGGLMSFIPVDDLTTSPAAAIHPIAGVVLGAFETSAMIENILAAKLRLVGLDIYVFDPNSQAGNRLIYWHSSSGKPALSEAALLAARHWTGTLELVDQRWNAVFAPAGSLDSDDWTAAAMLVGGLIMTASIVGYLLFSVRRTQQLETLTTSLRETTEELRRNGEKLDHLAHHDVLTGLPNRAQLHDLIAWQLEHAEESGEPVAVFCLDLDRFKAVNDTYGHQAGDRMLQVVAERIRANIRSADAAARIGGDEFILLMTGITRPNSISQLARRLIASLSDPFKLGDFEARIGASIGIAVGPRDGTTAETLIKNADIALYRAKSGGRGGFCFFESGMDLLQEERRAMEQSLREAVAAAAFELVFQPQFDCVTNEVKSLEALMRWTHPSRGAISPNEFIPLAEATGLIVPLGEWLLRTACRAALSWPIPCGVAVNVSARQFVGSEFADMVETVLTETGLDPSRLELEITEPVMMHETDATLGSIKRLKLRGIQLALDDFGTGFSSLSHLQRFPFDKVKIDRSLISDLTEYDSARAGVAAILAMSHELQLLVTAEGVETEQQLALLRQQDCDLIQGYLLSRPIVMELVPQFLAAQQRAGAATLIAAAAS